MSLAHRVLAWSLTLTLPIAGAAAQAPGDSIRLSLSPSGVATGTFLERTSELWRLSAGAGDPRLVPVADVRRAERQVTRTRSQLRSRSMFVGMLVGAAAGIAIYAAEIGSQPGDPGLGGLVILPLTAGGALYGAGIGWIAGSLRPLSVWREIR